ncbi:OsmC-like protein [Citrobacter koseri]|uniref:OsmC-like protein n=1 Tax=Citrobacter koseri TaxID=545 RepID=A0A3S4IA42_CITKO|nr:OsmC-like protein [Citrobacter koseri]
MQARVKWVEGLTFLGESASGHQVLMDGNSGDKAPSPMEMVLMAAGGCSAIDVVSILQKRASGCDELRSEADVRTS